MKVLIRAGEALLPAILVLGCTSPAQDRASPGPGDPDRGMELMLVYGCDACHVIPGVEGAVHLVGPPLVRWAERSYIAGTLPNTPEYLIAWIRDPQAFEPGTAMPSLGIPEEDARDMASYLLDLGTARPVGGRSSEPRALLRWFGLRPGVGEGSFHYGGRGDVGDEPAVPMEGGDPDAGRRALDDHGCGTCHTIPGVRSAWGMVGPPLDAWSRRGFIAGALANTPENLVRWILDPQAVEPGTLMPSTGLTPGGARDVAAYLFSLR